MPGLFLISRILMLGKDPFVHLDRFKRGAAVSDPHVWNKLEPECLMFDDDHIFAFGNARKDEETARIADGAEIVKVNTVSSIVRPVIQPTSLRIRSVRAVGSEGEPENL